MILILVLAARKMKYNFVCVCLMFEIFKTCRYLKLNKRGIYPVGKSSKWKAQGHNNGISHHAEAEMTSLE